MSQPTPLPYARAAQPFQASTLLSKLGPLVGLIFVWLLFAA